MDDHVLTELKRLFLASQQTTAVHQKNAQILKKLYDQSDHDNFWNGLKVIINCLLTFKKDSPFIQKAWKFMGSFCSLLVIPSENEDYFEDHPLLFKIVLYLLELSKIIDDNIRVRSCQLLNIILENFTFAYLNQEMCENIESYLLKSMQDSKAIMRYNAVAALYTLQDPTLERDKITSEMLCLMNSDTYPKVRQICIEKIALGKDVVSALVDRTLDVNINVRMSAYSKLSKLPHNLKICERRKILCNALTDESDKIKECSTNLVKSWINFYESNILLFLNDIKDTSTEDEIDITVFLYEKTLLIIFSIFTSETLYQTLTINEELLVPFDKLNFETVSFWRIYVQYLSSQENQEEMLGKIIPELVHFCKYIKKFYMQMPKEGTENQYILKQLFLTIKSYDFGDEASRRCVKTLVLDTLKDLSLSPDVTETVVGVLEYVIPNINHLTEYVSEIISEILYPVDPDEEYEKNLEYEVMVCRLKANLTQMQQELEEAIKEKDFNKASKLNESIENISQSLEKLQNSKTEEQVEKKADDLTKKKCLDIAAALLLIPKINKLTPSCKTLKDFIQELIIYGNDFVRAKALKCYGLLCIIDEDLAKLGIHIFSKPLFGYQSGEECNIQTLQICISAVVDILRIYGTQLIAAPESEDPSESLKESQQGVFAGGTTLTDILQSLVDLMDDKESTIQLTAANGLCKLVFFNKITSSSILARLILKWCNPATDINLRQVIGLSLEQIPLDQYSNRLLDAVLLTMEAIALAPTTSPLINVDLENTSKFMIALVKMSSNANSIYLSLACKIMKKFIKNKKNKTDRVFAKILLMLDVTENGPEIKELLDDCNRIVEVHRDRIVVNNVKKFIKKLNLEQADDKCNTLIEE